MRFNSESIVSSGVVLAATALAIMFIIPFCDQVMNGSSSSSSNPRSILEGQGYKNIQMEGTAFFGCSEDDSSLVSEHFSAVSPQGGRVKGTVCCGLMFKGCTVRFR